jgi:dolichol-phosphate mannosyltransferase
VSAQERIDFTVVVPVYFNEGLLADTMRGLHESVLAANPQRRGEVVFVDDGSGDGSLRELLEIRARHPECVRVIKLTRNFGQVSAIRAGMAHARGECAIAMSADGQDPSDLVNEMLSAYFDEGCEVVICARQGRDESAYRVWTSRFFYRLMRRICFPDMPSGGFDFVLLGRRARLAYLRSREAQPFFQGQILWMGFRTRRIEYRRLERRKGVSRWTFARKLTYLIDGVTSYSFLPLRMVSAAGILTAGLGFLYALVVLVNWLVQGHPVKGWTPLMIVVLILGGGQMLTLGIFGEYLWRVLAQVQQREPYLVDRIYDGAHPDGVEPVPFDAPPAGDPPQP